MHKKKAGKLQTGSTIPKQYWLAVNGKPKRKAIRKHSMHGLYIPLLIKISYSMCVCIAIQNCFAAHLGIPKCTFLSAPPGHCVLKYSWACDFSLSTRNGADRSGLLCVVAVVLERLKVEQEVAISHVIEELRNCREQIIPTLVHGLW